MSDIKEPVHPYTYLLGELNAREIDVNNFENKIGVKNGSIVAAKDKFLPETAIKIESEINVPAEIWNNLYSLYVVDKKAYDDNNDYLALTDLLVEKKKEKSSKVEPVIEKVEEKVVEPVIEKETKTEVKQKDKGAKSSKD